MLLRQDLSNQIPQRTSQPLPDRRTEAPFRPVKRARRQIIRVGCPQRNLFLATVHQLARMQAPGPLRQAVIQKRRTPFHAEGGKENRPKVVHFQLRPDPLAK